MAVVALWLGSMVALAAAPPPGRELGYQQRVWGAAEGAPANVYAVINGPDGYLWLGADAGLFRFDGARFSQVRAIGDAVLPMGAVSRLKVVDDGSTVVGFVFGGAARLVNGHLDIFRPGEQGFPEGTVYDVASDREGHLWAATSRGLARLDQGHWSTQGEEAGVPDGPVFTVVCDARGDIWATAGAIVLRKTSGADAFAPVDQPGTRGVQSLHSSLMLGKGGSIWVAGEDQGFREVADAQGNVLKGGWLLSDNAPDDAVFDPQGVFWLTFDEALAMASPDALAAPKGASAPPILVQPMTSPIAGRRVTVDPEGTVWIGTTTGLESLRQPRFVPARPPGRMQPGTAMAPQPGGIVTVSTRGLEFLSGNAPGTPVPAPVKPPALSLLHTAADGTLWLATTGGLWHKVGATFEPVRAPALDGAHDPQAMAVATDGCIWLSVARSGVFVRCSGEWVRNAELSSLPAEPAVTMLAAPDGSLFLGYTRSRVARVSDGAVDWYGPSDGLAVGTVQSLYLDGTRLVVGGENGVAVGDRGAFAPLQDNAGEPFAGVSGITIVRGELWLSGVKGISRIPAGDLTAFLKDSTRKVAVERFGYFDGLRGAPAQMRPVPTLVEDDQGLLWFSTTDGGVYRIDPAHISRNRIVPKVTIERLKANGIAFLPGRRAELPRGTHALQFEFSATSMAVPERVRFRYRMEGLDEGWQDGGDRRQAAYSNLGPGEYRFLVIASNNDGVWSATGESFAFAIAPAFYQRVWFRVLLGVLALSLVWLAHRLHVRHVARRTRLLVSERHHERERIARELHDTLLQSFQGLILRLHAMRDRMSPTDTNQQTIDAVLNRADDSLREARDRVSQLRAAAPADESLPTVVSEMAAAYPGPGVAAFELAVRGIGHPLRREVFDDLAQMIREAMHNAFAHARATSVRVDIIYRPAGLTVRIVDDGQGIERAILLAGGRAGHWGMVGMRERAAAIGATVQWETGETGGTVVDIAIGARAVYHRSVFGR